LLYWYKRTCFTGTKVQILTLMVGEHRAAGEDGGNCGASTDNRGARGARFTCFTRTTVSTRSKVQILTQGLQAAVQQQAALDLLDLLALLVQQ
jgi:hypothetical protein